MYFCYAALVSPPPADTRSSRKRAAILQAATGAFRDEGYDNASMDRIAERASVSKRTVYNHFGSKEALFQAVIEHHIQQVQALTTVRWDPERSLEAQLGDFARSKATVADNPAWMGLLRVVLGAFIRDPELARQTALRADHGEDALVRWLEAAHAAGRLQVADPGRAAEQFWALVKGMLFWPQVFQLSPERTREERDAIIGDLVETFLCRYRT